jgi:hypothetical protein
LDLRWVTWERGFGSLLVSLEGIELAWQRADVFVKRE